MVVVITNLRPRKLGGWPSAGMVMCAKTQDGSKVEFLRPPEGSKPGDPVFFEGYERKPIEIMAKKNPTWDVVAPKFVCDSNGVGVYKEDNGKCIPFQTAKGVCKSDTVKDGIVS